MAELFQYNFSPEYKYGGIPIFQILEFLNLPITQGDFRFPCKNIKGNLASVFFKPVSTPVGGLKTQDELSKNFSLNVLY